MTQPPTDVSETAVGRLQVWKRGLHCFIRPYVLYCMMMMTMTNSFRHLVGLAAAISTTLDILPFARKYDESHHVSALAMYD